MNEKIFSKTEEFVRKTYNLNDNYKINSCSIKPKAVEIEFCITEVRIKFKIDRDLVENL